MKCAEDMASCLIDAAQTVPEKCAFELWEQHGVNRRRLTFGELDRRARALAGRLSQLTQRGQRALLFCPTGPDFVVAFFGCLYAGVVAVPVPVPLAVQRSVLAARLQSIIVSAEPAVVVGPTSALSLLADGTEQADVFGRDLRLVALDDLADDTSSWSPTTLRSEDVAFLQYTSGSTSRPKGVMLTHGNLMANVKMIRHTLVRGLEDIRGVFWLPLFHDMGLIGGVLGNVYVRGTTVFIPPVDFIRRPITWLKAISETHANVSGGPDFGFQLAIERTDEAERADLDLSSWEVAFSGAERIRSATMERFASTFSPHGLRRAALTGCYGLAEASLLVSAGPIHAGAGASSTDKGSVVTSGTIADGLDLRIVDPETRSAVAPGKEGEIWVRGPSIAQGYWQDQSGTQSTFGARLNEGSDAYLRTGDLGFLERGQLYVTGRIKDLLIVAGRNHHPEDIEETARAAHATLKRGGVAAFSVEREGDEQVIVFAEVDGSPEQRMALQVEIERAVRQLVAQEHQLHVRSVTLLGRGRLPRTSSGKIQRFLCREQYLAQQRAPKAEVAAAHAQ